MVTYAGDELSWCVRNAGLMPLVLAQLHLMDPDTWFLLIFGYGYVTGTLLYILIQFDLEYKHRNCRDWHRIVWLVALPACLNLSPGFYPVKTTTRTFYALMLVAAFFFFQIMFVTAYEFIHFRLPWHQVSTIKEIIENNYLLAGSQEAFDVWHQSGKVMKKLKSSKSQLHVCSKHSSCLMIKFDHFTFVTTLMNAQ